MPLRSQPVPDLFWPSICLQRSSKELVVYSAQIHQVVVVAWYVSIGQSNSSTLTFDIPGRRAMAHVSFPIVFEVGSADTASSGVVFVPSNLAALLRAELCIARVGL